MRIRPDQGGQVLPIVALALFVLLGIAALVTDLGLSWMIRRQEQNAADAAAVAAARYIRPAGGGGPNVTAMRTAACRYAILNGFFETAPNESSCLPAYDSGSATLTVNYPPVGTGPGEYGGRPGFVQVIISRQRPSFFGAVFGRTTETVTTTAIAANTDGNSNSNSLVALDPYTCASAQIAGDTRVSITPAPGVTAAGGYVQVNSNCGNESAPPNSAAVNGNCDGGGGSGALTIAGGGSLTAPHTYTRGICKFSGSGATLNGALTEGAGYYDDPLQNLPRPLVSATGPGARCFVGGPQTDPIASGGCRYPAPAGGGGGGSATPSPTATATAAPTATATATGPTPSPTAPPPTCADATSTYTLQPGTYYGGWDIRNRVELRLEPGVYIIAGGGIKNTGGCIVAVGGSSGAEARVFIFNTDNPNYLDACKAGTATDAARQCQGSIDLTADNLFNVKAINTGPWRGLLLWHDGDGSCQYRPNCLVTLGGQASLNISGTIYAPKAAVELAGGSSGTGVASVQIIAWQWKITGGATLSMPYDPRELYRLEQRGLVR